MTPLGYEAAKRAVELGRGHFFGTPDADLPRGKAERGRSPIVASDDLIPQFGYVGARFTQSKVLLLGINPGNGDDVKRSSQDGKMMPALHQFAADLSVASFVEAQSGYKSVCQSWWVWQRHCSEVIGAGKLTLEDVAYSNALPWRTHSESNFDNAVGEKAATSYAYPLIDKLQPKVIVAMGKKAARILSLGGRSFPNLIVWNRAQVATPSVQQERAAAAKHIFSMIGRKVS